MLKIALPRLNCYFVCNAAYEATYKKNLEAINKNTPAARFFLEMRNGWETPKANEIKYGIFQIPREKMRRRLHGI